MILVQTLLYGFPALALNSVGHLQLTEEGGLFYGKKEEIVNKLQNLCNNYMNSQSNVKRV